MSDRAETDRKNSQFGAQMLDGFAVDVSHQEIERVVVELEELYKSQPGEWLPTHGIAQYIAEELGYEDVDEFEDALKCDFVTFISKLPHVQCAKVESELNPGTFRDCFKVTTLATDRVDGDGRESGSRTLRLRVQTKEDLWRVLMRSPNCAMEIPEIDFFVGGDIKRNVDSVYNHVAGAIFNLETHVSHMASSAETEAERRGIEDTCAALREMLDLNREWTLVVRDVDGTCAFKPENGIEIERE